MNMSASFNPRAELRLPIYLDNHATTPLDPRVLETMLPYLSDRFGNAASRNHQFGWDAQAAVETARGEVARLIGAAPQEIIFTSGATESDNLAIQGVAEEYIQKGDHIITAVTEHQAVLNSCKHLEKHGYKITYLPVKPDGLIDLQQLEEAITRKTILVSIMAANNEIGILQPIEEIGKICRNHEVFFHSDAVQAAGKVLLDVNRMSLDLVSLTAHKFYGPKGCGALYIRSKDPQVRLSAMMHGGGQERGIRSGTLNVPGIVGFGKACEMARLELPEEGQRIRALRDRLYKKLASNLDTILVNGSMAYRLPGNLNVAFLYADGESLLTGISQDVAVSSGGACTSAKSEPSHVLKALGLDDEAANSSLRFGIGRFNTEAEIDYTADHIIELVANLRGLSTLYPGD